MHLDHVSEQVKVIDNLEASDFSGVKDHENFYISFSSDPRSLTPEFFDNFIRHLKKSEWIFRSCFFGGVVLGKEPRALCMLGNHSLNH
jgi:hypothetical protein